MSKKGKDKGKELKQLKSKGVRPRPKPNYNIVKPVDETSKQFYLWQIHSLEEKNSKFQKLLDDLTVNESQRHEKLLQKLADKADMIGFLKNDLQNKVDAYNDLNDKYLTCMQLLDTERYICHKNLQNLRKETDESYALLYAENVKLVSKLSSLEEFFANKASITRRLAEAESKIVQMESEHKTTVLDMEKNFIISKQRLKAEMIGRIKRVAAEFRKATKKSQSTTFKKTSAENSALRSKLASVSDKFELVIRENEHLLEELRKAIQAKEFANSDTKLLFQRYDACLAALGSCNRKISKANNELMQVPLDADYKRVYQDNARLKSELAESKMQLADLGVKHDTLAKKCLQQELLTVLDSKKRQQLEGMLSNAIVAIKEAVANLVPRKDFGLDESVRRRRSTKPTIKPFFDIIEEQPQRSDEVAIEVELSGSTHFPGYVFKSKRHSSVSLTPIRSSIVPASEPEYSGIEQPSASKTLVDKPATNTRQEADRVRAPKIQLLSAQGSNFDFDLASAATSQMPSVSQTASPSVSHTSRIPRKHKCSIKGAVSLSSEMHLAPKCSKSQGETFTQSLMQALEQRQPKAFKKSAAQSPSLSIDEIVPIQSKILESLAVVVKSANDLGLQIPDAPQEKAGTQHAISLVPDLPRCGRSQSKTFKTPQQHSPNQLSKQAHSLTLEDVDATTALNLTKLRDALCQNFKPLKTCSKVQVYTKEDMLEYLLVLLDSAAHLGAGVQQSQLDVLWQHATGEKSAPKMKLLNRASRAHYVPGDLGLVPKMTSTAVRFKRKPKQVKCRDDPGRCLKVDDKAVQTMSIPQMIANISMEEKHTLRNEKWINQEVGGLANNQNTYDADCCDKTLACPPQTS